MSKPIIAVDIDDVLTPHFADLINWYNAQYGTFLTEYDNHPSDPGNWGTDDVNVAIKRVQRFFNTQNFLKARPFEEAQNVLNELSADYTLIVVTARDTIIEQVTRNWLDSHFKELFKEVHFTAHFSLEGKKRSKFEVLSEAEARYFIDDSLEHCLSAAENGLETILFGDYAWNQIDKLPSNMARCSNWAEVKGYFDATRRR